MAVGRAPGKDSAPTLLASRGSVPGPRCRAPGSARGRRACCQDPGCSRACVSRLLSGLFLSCSSLFVANSEQLTSLEKGVHRFHAGSTQSGEGAALPRGSCFCARKMQFEQVSGILLARTADGGHRCSWVCRDGVRQRTPWTAQWQRSRSLPGALAWAAVAPVTSHVVRLGPFPFTR